MPIVIAGPPKEPVAIPNAIQAVMGPGETAEPVWKNELGGLTFRLSAAENQSRTRYAKWSPHIAGLDRRYRGNDLAAEAKRINWAHQWIDVPDLLEYRQLVDGELLVTRAINASSAVSQYWLARPETAARAIGRGLRTFHDALPVAKCPFIWSVAERVDYGGLAGTVEGNALIADAPPILEDELVVCHGDACAPNFLIHPNGEVAGYVDLGRLGIASRWADLAVAAWSTEWNYGIGYTGLVYEAYGIAPDIKRIAYYRRVWDAM